MKIGMELDPVEEFDRQLERAVAAAVKAKFRHGDVEAALREVDRLTKQRLAMNAGMTRLCA